MRIDMHLFIFCIAITLAFSGLQTPAMAEEILPALSKDEMTFYVKVIEPALRIIKKAMPPAPKGWIVESEASIESQLTASTMSGPGSRQNSYIITYKRTADIAAEMAKLDAAYEISRKKHQEEAGDRLSVLEKKRSDNETALQKAKKSGNKTESHKLSTSLDEIRRQQEAVTQEIAKKVMIDTEPFLVKDASITIRVLLNEEAAEFPSGKGFRGQRAAFTLRKEGEREGDRGWKEPQTFLLYGNWREVSHDRFVAKMQDYRYVPKVQTIMLLISGDPSRVDEFLALMNMRSILNLMQ